MSEEKLNSIEGMVKDIHKCLYGDGNPGAGLTDRVSKIEVRMVLMSDQMKWGMRIFGGIVFVLLILLGVKEIPKFW